MRLSRRKLILGALGTLLAACTSKFKTYSGPEVTRIEVFKGQRAMRLMHHNATLTAYRFELGFAPAGHKMIEGDGRTPEGAYLIDRRNPKSEFHLSLGISYPNARDVAVAEALGKRPGGNIFIHGTPRKWAGQTDWTWGCIAVTNDEMEDIYAMVRTGTPIYIYP